MMSRPMLLAFLLMILIITSQFEWKQSLVNDIDSTQNISRKQNQIEEQQEAVKEKIILSQERHIQKLNELVRGLREQLQQCQNTKETTNSTVIPFNHHVIELERKPIIDD